MIVVLELYGSAWCDVNCHLPDEAKIGRIGVPLREVLRELHAALVQVREHCVWKFLSFAGDLNTVLPGWARRVLAPRALRCPLGLMPLSNFVMPGLFVLLPNFIWMPTVPLFLVLLRVLLSIHTDIWVFSIRKGH